MAIRKMFPLAVAFGLWTTGGVMAEPKPSNTPKPTTPVENQKLADAVAAKLKASGVIKGAKINIETRGGTVILGGTVVSQKQHEDILRAVTGIQGITRIESEIQSPLPPAPAGMPVAPVAPVAPMAPATKPVGKPNIIQTAGELEQAPMFTPPVGPNGAAMVAQDPVPLNGMPAMAAMDAGGPRLPPNAWPTYAPYNNFSRVAYPSAYPYNAFPYIGPFYPFPKVPLGWRKVVLEWDDGHWYMGRLQTPHDYWRIKFW